MEESKFPEKILKNMPDFVNKNNKSKLLEDIISKDNNRKSKPEINSSFDPSIITGCIRKLCYFSIGENHTPKYSYIESTSRKENINKWINILRDSFHLNVIDEHILLADSKYNVSGEAHALISIDEDVYVTQIHPLCDEDFNRVKEKGALKKDVVGIIILLWLLELEDSLILYSNMNNSDFTVFHVEPYTPIINAIKSKCEIMIRHKMDGTLLERPYENESSDECLSCEFRNKCWR